MRSKINLACFLVVNGLTLGVANAGDITFTNGDFTSLTGWTQGGGIFSSPLPAPYIMDPSNYTSGTSNNTIITAAQGNDPIVSGLSMTYQGANSVRVNDSNNNKSISTISQTVTNYGGSTINFAWSAVLQYAQHAAQDTDAFTLKVVDNFDNSTLKLVTYNAVSAANLFTSASTSRGAVYYSGWQAESIAVTQGHSFTVSLLAADCDAGGHFGYVYLSSFGANPVQGLTPVGVVQSLSIPDIVSGNNPTAGYNRMSAVGNGNHTNRFDGGTLVVDGSSGGGAGSGTRSSKFTTNEDFIIAAGANKAFIDQNNYHSAFTGLIANDTTNGHLIIVNGNGSTRTGSVSLAAGNTYSGGTEVQAGATLSINDPSAIGTGGLALVGSSTVPATLETTADMTISAPITVSGDPVFSVASGTTTTISSPITDGASPGDVVVSGGGTLALTAVNTYTGPTTVDSGSTLSLSGAGSITTSTAVNNNGNFNVTAKTGDVSLGGTFTQTSTGSLLMNISPTNNQKILVTGAASLAGVLSVAASSGNYAAGRYTLITANGVAGTFSSFTTDLSSYTRLGYALGYDANNVFLYLTPNVDDTQQSLVVVGNALKSTYALQNSVMANTLNYDCKVFDQNNICLSAGGRNTTVDAGGINNFAALLVAAYRPRADLRLGAYLDQNLSVNAGGSPVKLGVNAPMFGVFGVWNQNPDETGVELRMSAGYGQKNVSITRPVINTSEAGTGSSSLSNFGIQAVAKYGFGVTKNAVVSPYAGIRYSQGNMGGYSEAASSSVTSPLTYSALNTDATTFMAGVQGKYNVTPKAVIQASAGLETDMGLNNGSINASGLTGLAPVAFNPNPVKTRPVAMIGTYYDIEKNHRVGLTGIWRQEPFQAVGSATVIATYTVGL